ncbi:MAG: OmpA family protein [Acidobacteriota bacterium]
MTSIPLLRHALRLSCLVLLFALVGCASSGPPPLTMVAEVVSEPVGLTIVRDGEVLGAAPIELGLDGLEEASELTVAKASNKILERRIQILGPRQVRVVLTLADQASALAEALGLTDILVFDYGERASFKVSSHDLDPELLPILQNQAELLEQRFAGIDLHICGHTDSSGRDDSNRVLSVRRAQAVADVLMRHGVSADRLNIQGFASDYPLAPNDTTEGKALNRRTEIVIGE